MMYRFEKMASRMVVSEEDERDDEQCAAEEDEHEADLVHRGMEAFGHLCGIGDAVDAGDPFDGGDEVVEEFLVFGCGREGEFEGVEQGVFLEDLLEFGAEHLAEFGIFGLFLFGGEGDRGDEIFGVQPVFDRGPLFVGDSVLEFDGHGDALLQRIGDLHGGGHQVADRSEEEEDEGDADRRDDV